MLEIAKKKKRMEQIIVKFLMTNIVLDPTKNDEKNDMIALTLRIRYSKSFVNLHTRKKI